MLIIISIKVGAGQTYTTITHALGSLTNPAGDVELRLVSDVSEPPSVLDGLTVYIISVPNAIGITSLSIISDTGIKHVIDLKEVSDGLSAQGLIGGIFANGVSLTVGQNIEVIGSVFGGSYCNDLLSDTNVTFHGILNGSRRNLFGGSYLTCANPSLSAQLNGNIKLTVGANAVIRATTASHASAVYGGSYANGNYSNATANIDGSISVTVNGDVQQVYGGSLVYGTGASNAVSSEITNGITINYNGLNEAEVVCGGCNLPYSPQNSSSSRVATILGDIIINLNATATNVCGLSRLISLENNGTKIMAFTDSHMIINISADIIDTFCGNSYVNITQNSISSAYSGNLSFNFSNTNLQININSDVSISNFYGNSYVSLLQNAPSLGTNSMIINSFIYDTVNSYSIRINVNNKLTCNEFFSASHGYFNTSASGYLNLTIGKDLHLDINAPITVPTIYNGSYTNCTQVRGALRGENFCNVSVGADLSSCTLFGSGKRIGNPYSGQGNIYMDISGTVGTIFAGEDVESSTADIPIDYISLYINYTGSVGTCYGGSRCSNGGYSAVNSLNVSFYGIADTIYGGGYAIGTASVFSCMYASVYMRGQVNSVYGSGRTENNGSINISSLSNVNIRIGALFTEVYGKGSGSNITVANTEINISGFVRIKQDISSTAGIISLGGTNLGVGETNDYSGLIDFSNNTFICFDNTDGTLKFNGQINGPDYGKLSLIIFNLTNIVPGKLIITQDNYTTPLSAAYVMGVPSDLYLVFNVPGALGSTNEGRLASSSTFTVSYDANAGIGTVPVDPNNYQYDATVTVLPNSGLTRQEYKFFGWCMDIYGSGTIYKPGDTFNMPFANVTLYAIWTKDSFFTTTTAFSSSDGAISPMGEIDVRLGHDQTFYFTPDIGNFIESVYIDGEYNKESTQNGCHTFNNVIQNHSVFVTFEAITYQICASSNKQGNITPNGSIDVIAGQNYTFIFTPCPGHFIQYVKIDDVVDHQATQDGFYIFNNVQENHKIFVCFD